VRRLVFLTQSVDPAHPVLAATLPKVRALAERVDEVVVLAQSGVGDGLPANVEVRSFGADSQVGRGWRFERELARSLPADAVVAHMIPVYVLLAAPLVRPRGIPLLLWYTHWKATAQLRAAEKLATAIVSVDRRSFPVESQKVRPIGHGIDVSEFPCTDRSGRSGGVRALVLGRYSPAKGIETILRAVQQVDGVEVDVCGAALNDLERQHRRELERFGVPLHDAVPRAEVPGLLAEADVLVNNMEAGAPDKVVYEAAAACLPVFASNPIFDELLDPEQRFTRWDPRALADRIRGFSELARDERAALGRRLHERVAAGHSVESWARGILDAAGLR
jgi:glycosyltransferase involved in cell wall biosynthesis